MRLLGQIHQQSTGNTELGGQPRTLAADRFLDDLHHQGLAFKQHLLDRFGCLDVVAVFPYIRHMQKGRALQADIYERGLHPGQHAFDLAEVNVADDAATAAALDVQILHHAELHHRNAGFLRGDVDQYLFAHVYLYKFLLRANRGVACSLTSLAYLFDMSRRSLI